MTDDVGRLMQRTVGCGQLTTADAAHRREVVLTGWVHRRRDLGRLIFVEMRDATGRAQVVFDPDRPEIHALAGELRRACGSAAHAEYVDLARAAFSGRATLGSAYVTMLRAMLEPLDIVVFDSSHEA